MCEQPQYSNASPIETFSTAVFKQPSFIFLNIENSIHFQPPNEKTKRRV